MTRRKTPPPAATPKVYSLDNWPPGFVSAIEHKPTTKKAETQFEQQQRNRAAGGFDAHGMKLPGSGQYTSAGPVQMMTRERT